MNITDDTLFFWGFFVLVILVQSRSWTCNVASVVKYNILRIVIGKKKTEMQHVCSRNSLKCVLKAGVRQEK